MKIKAGDTLSGIAKRNGTTVAKLLAANPSIKNANSIRAGQNIMLPESLSKNSPNYTGKRESNPYKGTDLSTLQMRGGNKTKNNNVTKDKKDKPKVSQSKTSYPKVSQGSTMAKKQAPKKKSIGSKFMSFIKGEGSKMKKDLDNAVSETKRNFGPGRMKSISKGTSNITNSSTYKKKVDKKNRLAMQKKQQNKKLPKQMST